MRFSSESVSIAYPDKVHLWLKDTTENMLLHPGFHFITGSGYLHQLLCNPVRQVGLVHVMLGLDDTEVLAIGTMHEGTEHGLRGRRNGAYELGVSATSFAIWWNAVNPIPFHYCG